jgi:rhodanese-related sulfurtransferase
MNKIKLEEVVIIDVRTPEEFMGGHVAGSLNIPLDEVPARVAEFAAIEKPIIVCCRSGARSGQAQQFLMQHYGIQTTNGGGWTDVNALID